MSRRHDHPRGRPAFDFPASASARAPRLVSGESIDARHDRLMRAFRPLDQHPSFSRTGLIAALVTAAACFAAALIHHFTR